MTYRSKLVYKRFSNIAEDLYFPSCCLYTLSFPTPTNHDLLLRVHALRCFDSANHYTEIDSVDITQVPGLATKSFQANRHSYFVVRLPSYEVERPSNPRSGAGMNDDECDQNYPRGRHRGKQAFVFRGTTTLVEGSATLESKESVTTRAGFRWATTDMNRIASVDAIRYPV